MRHDAPQPQPGLLGGGDNLIGWQQEAVVPGISQLKCEGVLDAIIVRPVDAAAASWVCKSEGHTP